MALCCMTLPLSLHPFHVTLQLLYQIKPRKAPKIISWKKCLGWLKTSTSSPRRQENLSRNLRRWRKRTFFWEKHNPLKINFFFFPTAVFLALHSHEQSCASDLSAGLPAAGLLWPGCGLWSAGSFLWHAHPLLYGSRGENHFDHA